MFHTVAPGVLGSWEQFRQRFAQPIEREGSGERRAALARLIAPFLLRRTKQEVLLELPARTEVNLLVELSPEERQCYEQARRLAVAELDELERQDSVSRMLAAHPRLALPGGLDEPTRAFMAGYLTHLLMDEHYIERIYREYFGAHSALRGDPRADLLDRVIQYEWDRRERERTDEMVAIREAMASTGALADVEQGHLSEQTVDGRR